MANFSTTWFLKLKETVLGPLDKIIAKSGGAEKAIAKITAQQERLERVSGNLMGTLAKFAATGAVFGVMTYGALQFNQGFAEINTTARLNEQGLGDLRSTIMTMAADSGTALDTVPKAFANILDQVNDTGLSVEVLGVALKGADAGFTNVDTVAAALAQTLSIVGKENTNAAEVMDTLFAARREGAGEFADFARYIPGLIASGKSLGVGFKETAGLFGYMTGKGFSAEKSAVLMENAFSALGKSEIRDGLAAVNVDVFDKATGKIRSFQSIMTDLSGVMGGMNDSQKADFLENIGLRDTQAKAAIMAMSSDLTKMEEVMLATAKAEGAMAEAAKAGANPMLELNKGLNGLKVAAIEAFSGADPLVSALGRAASATGRFVTWLAQLNPEATKWIVSGAAMIIGLGAIGLGLAVGVIKLMQFKLWMTTNLILIKGWSVWTTIASKSMAIWSAVTGVAAKVMAGLNAVMYANPAGLITLAILALVAVVTAVIVKWNEWGAALSIFLGPLGMVISIVQSFRRNWDMVVQAFQTDGILGGLKAIGKTLLDAILMPLQQMLEIVAKVTGFDWAADAAKGLEKFRTDMGVTVTPTKAEAKAQATATSAKAETTKPAGSALTDLNALANGGGGSSSTAVATGAAGAASGASGGGNRTVHQHNEIKVTYVLPPNWKSELASINDEILAFFTKAAGDSAIIATK